MPVAQVNEETIWDQRNLNVGLLSLAMQGKEKIPFAKVFNDDRTVEPTFGPLPQFMGLRKINSIGWAKANKVIHLSAIAYNLKFTKYL
ncbi:hypothetical protein [Zobellia sp. OII3]|uniref:hypothetical protein n=1 Tax=Zobellia sp. OII3 TaxID=2034520 RepID=UPI001F469C96|nr:hypothetical protein [Zobellia sp. OII3]